MKDFITYTVGGDITIAAHSLGNMLVSSAINDWGANVSKYFLINAAVALEAYGDAAQDSNMSHPYWNNYDQKLWASEWYRLFSAPDGRSKLTWRNRFANLPKEKLYNYFSSGDEVFEVHPNQDLKGVPDIPGLEDFNSGKLLDVIHVGRFSWSLQEKLKGRMMVEGYTGSTYGGWGFNLNDYAEKDPYGRNTSTPISFILANGISEADLKTKPFFNVKATDMNLLSPENGSQYALDNRDRLLAEAIPARTGAAGRNEIRSFLSLHNKDMQINFTKKDAEQKIIWPRADKDNIWLHSDIREVAYPYIYSVFDDFIQEGGLK